VGTKVRIGRLVPGLLALGLGLVLTCADGEAQVKKGKTRVTETKFLMRGVMAPNCAALGKLLKAGPSDDKAWVTAACHASILNEMSYVVMDDGRCPDKTWATAAKTLRSCSSKVLEAVKAQNGDEARAAFKALTGACDRCHKAHKT
jgi:hypothetical protein